MPKFYNHEKNTNVISTYSGWLVTYTNKTIDIFGMIYGENIGLVSQIGESLVTLLHSYIHLSNCVTAFFQPKETGSTTPLSSTGGMPIIQCIAQTKNECPL